MTTGALLAGVTLAVTAPMALAQLGSALQTGEQATRQAAQTQARINQLDDERSDAVREYRSVLQRIDAAKLLEMQQGRVVESQRAELASLREQLGRVDEIALQMTPMMLDMIAAIEEFYAADLPFKDIKEGGVDARAERMERLKDVMNIPNVSAAERYRVIVEAYQAEMDYGRTIDTYEDTVEVNGEVKTVDVFRFGRVSMTYLTQDRQRSGVWNRDTKAWEPLPSSYNADILAGIRMAKQVAAPQVLFAPLRKLNIGNATPPALESEAPAAPAPAPTEPTPAEPTPATPQ